MKTRKSDACEGNHFFASLAACGVLSARIDAARTYMRNTTIGYVGHQLERPSTSSVPERRPMDDSSMLAFAAAPRNWLLSLRAIWADLSQRITDGMNIITRPNSHLCQNQSPNGTPHQ